MQTPAAHHHIHQQEVSPHRQEVEERKGQEEKRAQSTQLQETAELEDCVRDVRHGNVDNKIKQKLMF